jgi:hypothetical protein
VKQEIPDGWHGDIFSVPEGQDPIQAFEQGTIYGEFAFGGGVDGEGIGVLYDVIDASNGKVPDELHQIFPYSDNPIEIPPPVAGCFYFPCPDACTPGQSCTPKYSPLTDLIVRLGIQSRLPPRTGRRLH